MDTKFKEALEEAIRDQERVISPEDNSSEDTSSIQTDAIAESARDELDRRKHKTKSRKTWGKVLLVMVVAGFATSYLIIIAIGLDVLNYDDSQFAVPSVIAAGVIGTYGLAKIAVSYFFTD